jgi:hypothetical protein
MVRFTLALVAAFTVQACATLNPNAEAELRKELAETKAQITELHKLSKAQKAPLRLAPFLRRRAKISRKIAAASRRMQVV